MAKWKNIRKLSTDEQSKREAAFEAAMMAELAKGNPPRELPSPAAPPATPSPDAITITIIENGKKTTYPDPASVPLSLRQRIVNAWGSKPLQ